MNVTFVRFQSAEMDNRNDYIDIGLTFQGNIVPPK